jgi:TolB-like protein/Flp pilus assembly protein TadD
MSLFQELKRRNVFRVGIAYVLLGWAVLQGADFMLDLAGAPDWVIRVFAIAGVVGFPFALFFAWAFELTPEGIKRESEIDRSQPAPTQTGRKLNGIIIGLLVVIVALLLADRLLRPAPRDVAAERPIAAQPETAGRDSEEAVEDKSIAVLPFAHRSANADDLFFTDGIHDDLLTLLAKQDAFKVISRTSVMEYRDTTKNMKEVGSELGVRHILEGGVQRAGTRVRINVQLIDAATDEHLWAEMYDRELTTDNLFDIQSEIATAIAGALQATLSGSSLDDVGSAPTRSLPAYDLYHRAKQLTIGNSQTEWQAAVDLYEEAITLDPEFALAFLGLAEAYLTLYWSYEGDPSKREASRRAIDQAIALEPDLPEIHMAEGFYHYWGRLDYETALSHLDRAIERMPNNAEAHMWRGWTLRRSGRLEDALVSMRRSLELDPRAPFNWLEYGQTLSYLHRFDEALAAIEQTRALRQLELWASAYTSDIYLQRGDITSALEQSKATLRSNEPTVRFALWQPLLLSRDFAGAQRFVDAWTPGFEVWRMRYHPKELMQAIVYRLAGDTDAARSAANRAIERLQSEASRFPPDYRKHLALAEAYATAGDREAARREVEQALDMAPSDFVEGMDNRYYMARSLALVGESARAIELLEPLLPGPSKISVRFVELDPHWDGLRDDPDFVALLERYR